MSNDTGSSPNEGLARNLRRMRVAARVSLSQLARVTGVGKATLSAIENGRGNPTLDTLTALADALGVPLVDLVAMPAGVAVKVVRRGDGELLADGRERLGRVGAGELHRMALDAHELIEADPLGMGARLHVVVTSGTLVTGPSERITELGPGDYATYPADVPHVFRTARRGAAALLAIEAG